MIAHREDITGRSALAAQFRVEATPTIVILDGDGIEHHRIVGFLPPEEFIPSLMLGIAKGDYAHRAFNRSLVMLDLILSSYPYSRPAPEARTLKQNCLQHRH
ncbi:MAG: thioredoxin family protein [Desulfomonile tiedjei]|nr:thioredoxin family protein [Desulfomonile tiedjei]